MTIPAGHARSGRAGGDSEFAAVKPPWLKPTGVAHSPNASEEGCAQKPATGEAGGGADPRVVGIWRRLSGKLRSELLGGAAHAGEDRIGHCDGELLRAMGGDVVEHGGHAVAFL